MVERYFDVAERAIDMISEVGEDGRIPYANPAHETILRYPAQFVTGRQVDEFVPQRVSSTLNSYIRLAFD